MPPSPKESAPLAHIFAIPAMKGPLPAELKFRENTECFIFIRYYHKIKVIVFFKRKKFFF